MLVLLLFRSRLSALTPWVFHASKPPCMQQIVDVFGIIEYCACRHDLHVACQVRRGGPAGAMFRPVPGSRLVGLPGQHLQEPASGW